MSYRAFKRLLGETSLERKCRFLFGGFILLLITSSFWLYARKTEHLAYDQIVTTCRLLMIQIVDRKLATVCQSTTPPREAERPKTDEQNPATPLDEFRTRWEEHWPESLRNYKQLTIRPNAKRAANMPDDAASIKLLEDFKA